MRNLIQNADGEKVLEVIEKCRGKSRLPVAVLVMGFDTRESDEMLEHIAETEEMEIADYSAIAMKYNYASPGTIETEWMRIINESMMGRRGVIIKRHFADNVLTRQSMINAAMTGMKHAKIILLKLSTDAMKGFSYYREKYGEVYASASQRAIAENLAYGKIGLEERIDYILEVNL